MISELIYNDFTLLLLVKINIRLIFGAEFKQSEKWSLHNI